MLPTKEAEGLRLKVYKDTVGVPTVGYGHNLNVNGSRELFARVGADYDAIRAGKAALTTEQADAIFQHDHAIAEEGARSVISNMGGNFDNMPKWLQNIVTDMSFNMGSGTLATFKQSLGSILSGDYSSAADSLSKTKWARQTGRRAKAIIADLRAGRDTYA